MDKFDEFCESKNMSKNLKEAFRLFLEKKYPNGIPASIVLEREWQSYLRD